MSNKMIEILGCKLNNEALKKFRLKHQLDAKTDGEINKDKAAQKSCRRNFIFKKYQQETNAVVYNLALKPNQEYEFYYDPTTNPKYCAAIFREVYQCHCVPTDLQTGSHDEIKECAEFPDCTSCRDVNYGQGFVDTVKEFIIQVEKSNGHLDDANAQVIGESGNTYNFNLRHMCRRTNLPVTCTIR